MVTYLSPRRVPADLLIHTEHGHTVKPLRVIKKQALTFVDNSVIDGVLGNVQMVRNAGYRQAIQHDGCQPSAYRPTGKL